ncbi:amidohydrolase family protein [Streptomyces pinistramenti]|uniref:amidohydrolase family protein n=1 Tax=Streptomyces pinistramenti TaxID=2884812 RepID=UPI001D08413D|nr:amidohydrolase family protein [Streptomyces pinistramenti]MCB5907377.1 amidohydrolase [Streptomyces pinistramenti]
MSLRRIDVHTHFVPDFYRDALIEAGHERPDGIARIPGWDVRTALRTMDELGVATAFLSISSPGIHFGDDQAARLLSRRVNEEAAQLCAGHPGRFGFFASLPVPDIEGALAEAAHAFDELGADGVVLETNHHGHYLGDDLYRPLYAELDRRAATLFVHPTSPLCAAGPTLDCPRPMLEFMFDTTRSVTDMVLSGALEQHPGLRVIVPHAGAALPVLAGRVDLMSEISGADVPGLRDALSRLYFDVAGAPVPELLTALRSVARPGHVFYGSDWPFTPAPVAVELGRRLAGTDRLSDDERVAVFEGNARRFFPRLQK